MPSPWSNTRPVRRDLPILCPFCLQIIAPDCMQCPSSTCNKEIPRGYLQLGSEVEAMVISAIGFSGHGKTVYLAALMHILDKLSGVWPHFYRQALNMESIRTVQENIKMLRAGKLPNMSKQNFPEPSIHLLKYIPDYGQRIMMIYDTSGENFEEDHRIQNNANFILKSRTAFLLISLDDLRNEENEQGEFVPDKMHRLLNTYTVGMDRLGGITNNQNLVIVFTKGDRSESCFQQKQDVWDYVNRSEIEVPNWSTENYMAKMRDESSKLAAFTEEELDARPFMNMAKDRFASVEFCLVSALGSAPVNGKLEARISPRRVIDPLLWAILKSEVPLLR